MATLRSYLKAEDAYLDAAFLGSMGIDASVVDACGNGGQAIGIAEPFIKIEVPEEQLAEALQWLAKRGQPSEAVHAPTFEPSWNTETLHRFLKFLLIFDLGCFVVAALFGHLLEPTPPKEVSDYLTTLVFSEQLWFFAHVSYWPLYVLSMVSNVLCLFQSKTGRLLFAVTTVWGLLTGLGPPPQIVGPVWDFVGSLQFTASNLALALMYWSPVRQKFDQPRSSK